MTHGAYNPLLVAGSILIAILASYTALDLANRLTAARGRVRLLWLIGGSLAMGLGIWSMQLARLREKEASAECRIVRPDGAVRWVRNREFPVRDASGQIRRVVGVTEDITEP